jgi:hypothetical protein
MSIELQKPTLDKTHVMRGFFISEFEKDLENKGVDTVCFMGYGYDIKEVKVGAEFYFSYLYYGRMSDMRNGTKEECLRSVLLFEKHNGNDKFFDRYKILQKFKYFDCSFLDTINRKVVPIKQRREYVKIKNLRTNEITVMSEDTIGYSHLFCWVSW